MKANFSEMEPYAEEYLSRFCSRQRPLAISQLTALTSIFCPEVPTTFVRLVVRAFLYSMKFAYFRKKYPFILPEFMRGHIRWRPPQRNRRIGKFFYEVLPGGWVFRIRGMKHNGTRAKHNAYDGHDAETLELAQSIPQKHLHILYDLFVEEITEDFNAHRATLTSGILLDLWERRKEDVIEEYMANPGIPVEF